MDMTVTVAVTYNLSRQSSYRKAPPFPLSIWTVTSDHVQSSRTRSELAQASLWSQAESQYSLHMSLRQASASTEVWDIYRPHCGIDKLGGSTKAGFHCHWRTISKKYTEVSKCAKCKFEKISISWFVWKSFLENMNMCQNEFEKMMTRANFSFTIKSDITGLWAAEWVNLPYGTSLVHERNSYQNAIRSSQSVFAGHCSESQHRHSMHHHHEHVWATMMSMLAPFRAKSSHHLYSTLKGACVYLSCTNPWSLPACKAEMECLIPTYLCHDDYMAPKLLTRCKAYVMENGQHLARHRPNLACHHFQLSLTKDKYK